MDAIQSQINQLSEQLNLLLKRHDDFSKEIDLLRVEINRLKLAQAGLLTSQEPTRPDSSNAALLSADITEKDAAGRVLNSDGPTTETPAIVGPSAGNRAKLLPDLEKFIGENLISKVGVVVTVIGVAIGAKYAIDHELISPLTRVILGYLVGLGLLGFAMKLKQRYENFSAVLLSGAMAILYFMTFAAYSFYDLIPQWPAFILMVLFTVFTVLAALTYNRQVIAHIGLVGAYAVPFLLSEGSGQVAVLFSYMAIINIGILVIAFKKYWKPLYYSAFALTWLIFGLWYASNYRMEAHFGLTLVFLCLFFTTFYLIFLAYKLLQKENYKSDDVLLLLTNSFLFFGIGYAVLDQHATGEQLLGVFTLVNALVHFLVSVVIYRQKLVNRYLVYLVSGLVLVFITIAIPVQLDGNWVTLLWAAEACLFFWMGRFKQVPVYEKLSYILMVAALFSLIQDWFWVYDTYTPGKPATRIVPLVNVHFLTSIIVVAAFGLINMMNRNRKHSHSWMPSKWISRIIGFLLPAMLLFTLYYAFRMEIAAYWNQLYADSQLIIYPEDQDYPIYFQNHDLERFKTVWMLIYSLFFVALLAYVNYRGVKKQSLAQVVFGLMVIFMALYLTQGLYVLSELRESYLAQSLSEYYRIGLFNLGIRYLSFAMVGLTLFTGHQYIRRPFCKRSLQLVFDLLLHLSVLWMASSEVINWMDIAESTQSYKLGLSILWGIYALLLIVLGIRNRMRHLRIGAIVLFGVTLVKLFFYDISHLDTIAKTIVLVSLGVLLLIVSFLYNKYKHLIFDEALR